MTESELCAALRVIGGDGLWAGRCLHAVCPLCSGILEGMTAAPQVLTTPVILVLPACPWPRTWQGSQVFGTK